MLTVPEAARRANRNPETIRRWIRAGRLPARKIGTQHVIEEHDLDAILDVEYAMLALPDDWRTDPQLNWVRLVRISRDSH
jgi:excisionase family DNA binding protein